MSGPPRPLAGPDRLHLLGISGLVTILVGLLATVVTFGIPVGRAIVSQGWRPTACTILSSDLLLGGGEGESTGFAISYEYEVEGKLYASSTYSFSGYTWSGSKESNRRIVERFEKGKRSTCAVNPRDPGEAVLERSVTADYYYGLIPLIFTLLGIGIYWLSVRGGAYLL